MSYLDRVRACNLHDLSSYLSFVVAGDRVGWVRRAFANELGRYSDVFEIGQDVRLCARFEGFAARTDAVESVLRDLRHRGLINGWKGERHNVSAKPGGEPLLAMDARAIWYFGVHTMGAHLNGYVRRGNGLALWVAVRPADDWLFPGKLDNLAAGGCARGMGPAQTIVKEAIEEAALPPDLLAAIMPVGAISYRFDNRFGLCDETMYVFDVELPESYRPHNLDGEVGGFHLWPVEIVLERVRDSDDFKYNCALVVIDFAIRHGLIPPDHPEYLALIAGLHAGL